MPSKTVVVALNGVTGRMGYRQHLVRSLLAIREQGGVLLPDGTSVVPEPVLVGRSEEKLRAIAERHGLPRWTTSLDEVLADPSVSVYFDTQITSEREPALLRALAAGKHVYTEKPVAASLDGAVRVARAARAAQTAGVVHGVVQDKLFLPGMIKLRRLVRDGFLGRVLAIRLEFGYWVFDGEGQPAQRPSWNYRREQGGGIVLDMFPHWQYLLAELFGPVTAVYARQATHLPRRWDEQGEPYDATADDAAYAVLEFASGAVASVNSSWAVRVNRRELVELQVDGTAGSAVAGLRHCAVQPAAVTPRPVWNPDLARPGRLPLPVDRRPGQPGFRQRLQGPVGAVPAACRHRQALSLGPGRGRPGGAARRGSAAVRRRGPPRRDPGPAVVTARVLLPGRAAPTVITASPWPARQPPPRSRRALAAPHVAAGPDGSIDWQATLEFRDFLWDYGFGVADAMDTAQRGAGLTWDLARELIRQSATRPRRGAP